MKRDQLQTIRTAFQQICEGEREWTALGNFMNYWYAYAKDRRQELVADPLPDYDKQSIHQQKWATFCAASVEWFCNKYNIACPSWVFNPEYTLSEPWFFYQPEPAKTILLRTTPEQFSRRNIFCGNRCFNNKWELAKQFQRRTA